jgi:hypothetical protein
MRNLTHEEWRDEYGRRVRRLRLFELNQHRSTMHVVLAASQDVVWSVRSSKSSYTDNDMRALKLAEILDDNLARACALAARKIPGYRNIDWAVVEAAHNFYVPQR